DFRPMLRHLRRRKRSPPSLRKWRLFACACCRRDLDLMRDEQSGPKVEVAERYADGEVSDARLRRAAEVRGYAAAFNSAQEDIRRHAEFVASDIVFYAGNVADYKAPAADKVRARQSACEEKTRAIARLAHDVFGNPFRPAALDPSWLAPAVFSLAQ